MQLYLLIPPSIFLYRKKPKFTFKLCLALIFANFISLFTYSYVYDLSISYVNMPNFTYGLFVLIKPWNHIHTFVWGFLLAIIYDYNSKTPEHSQNIYLRFIKSDEKFLKGARIFSIVTFFLILTFSNYSGATKDPLKQSRF